jgi:ABC-type amino acid transport substrate-binding protein
MDSMTRSLAVSLLALVAAGSVRAADFPEVKQRGVLKVLAWREEEPEMFNFGPGEPGFERELLERFARLQRLRLEVVPVTRFGDVIDMLNKREADMISGIIETEARRQLVDFTQEVLPARHVVVTWRPHRVVTSAGELQEEKVGVVRNTSWHAAAQAAGVPEGRLVLLPDRVAVFAALRDRAVTAAVMPLVDLTLMMKREPSLQAGLFVGEAGSAAWAVRKSDPD